MNFRGHLTGGVITGTLVSATAIISDHISFNQDSLMQFLRTPSDLHGDLQRLVLVFSITLVMSLFPDLDIGSVPQKWFLRITFVLLVFFYFTNYFDYFAVLSFFALSTVIARHRGWTHSIFAPWIIVLFLVLILEYFRVKNIPSYGINTNDNDVFETINRNWILILAGVLGHYTHLLLDSKIVGKMMWIFR